MKRLILFISIVVLFSTSAFAQVFSNNDIDSTSNSLNKLSSRYTTRSLLDQIENKDIQNLVKASEQTSVYSRDVYLNSIENEDLKNYIEASKQTSSDYRNVYLDGIKNADIKRLVEAYKVSGSFDWDSLIMLSLTSK